MISIDGLTVEFSGTTLFKDISFTIGDKDRIALMGKNGAGKSTLLKIIAGVRSATRGRVTVGEGGKVGYLPQHLQVEDGRTLVEEASRAFEHLFEIERRIAALNEQLTTRTDYESESYMRLIEEVTAISEKFYAVDLTNYQEDVERILLGLGFERSDFTRQTSEFSGGWRMRIELAKLLLQKPDLLLLDEPTNHLDIESIEWLEDFLMNFENTVIVVSHDRYFINQTATRILDLSPEGIVNYKGNYNYYLEQKEAGNVSADSDNITLAASADKSPAPSPEKAKEDWKRSREEAAKQRKRANDLKKTEKEISRLEAENDQLKNEMALPENATNVSKLMELNTKFEENESTLLELYDKWEELSE